MICDSVTRVSPYFLMSPVVVDFGVIDVLIPAAGPMNNAQKH